MCVCLCECVCARKALLRQTGACWISSSAQQEYGQIAVVDPAMSKEETLLSALRWSGHMVLANWTSGAKNSFLRPYCLCVLGLVQLSLNAGVKASTLWGFLVLELITFLRGRLKINKCDKRASHVIGPLVDFGNPQTRIWTY